MNTYKVNGQEVSFPDVHYVGELTNENRGHWFYVAEENHPFKDMFFGIDNVKNVSDTLVEYEIMLGDESINIEDVRPFIDEFVQILIGMET